MKQALHPNYFNPINEVKALQEDIANEQPLIEQEALHALSETKGWKILEELFDDIVEGIDGSVTRQMEAGASFEEIGKTSVIREITKDVIRRIRNKVGDAKESVDGRRAEVGAGKSE